MRPPRRTGPAEDPVAIAISKLSQPERDLLLRCVLEGEVLAAIANRTGAPIRPLPNSAAVNEARAPLTKIIDAPRGHAPRDPRR